MKVEKLEIDLDLSTYTRNFLTAAWSYNQSVGIYSVQSYSITHVFLLGKNYILKYMYII